MTCKDTRVILCKLRLGLRVVDSRSLSGGFRRPLGLQGLMQTPVPAALGAWDPLIVCDWCRFNGVLGLFQYISVPVVDHVNVAVFPMVEELFDTELPFVVGVLPAVEI